MDKTDRRLFLLATIFLGFFIHVYQSLAALIIVILGVTVYTVEALSSRQETV